MKRIAAALLLFVILASIASVKASSSAVYLPAVSRPKPSVNLPYVSGGEGIGKDGIAWWIYTVTPADWETALAARDDGKAITVGTCRIDNPVLTTVGNLEELINRVGGCFISRTAPNGRLFLSDPYTLGPD